MEAMVVRTSMAAKLFSFKAAVSPFTPFIWRSILLKRTLCVASGGAHAGQEGATHRLDSTSCPAPSDALHQVHQPRRGVAEGVGRVLEEGGGQLQVVEGEGLESRGGALQGQRLVQRLRLQPGRRQDVGLGLGSQGDGSPQGHLHGDLHTTSSGGRGESEWL